MKILNNEPGAQGDGRDYVGVDPGKISRSNLGRIRRRGLSSFQKTLALNRVFFFSRKPATKIEKEPKFLIFHKKY